VVNYPWPQEKADADKVLERIKQTAGSSASECIAIEADLSTIDGPQHLINEVIRHTGGKIDILVNNAGIAMMAPLPDIVLAQWDAQVNLNVRGMLLLTQAALPHLAQDSRIVNLSSVGARQGYTGATIYNGTKSMIESFTRCWALCVP
jgi:NAD(P)-dependent dehydrogenase (short-subunit alcohol dehydrogenase family)